MHYTENMHKVGDDSIPLITRLAVADFATSDQVRQNRSAAKIGLCEALIQRTDTMSV